MHHNNHRENHNRAIEKKIKFIDFKMTKNGTGIFSTRIFSTERSAQERSALGIISTLNFQHANVIMKNRSVRASVWVRVRLWVLSDVGAVISVDVGVGEAINADVGASEALVSI